jgi:hypothetical protein
MHLARQRWDAERQALTQFLTAMADGQEPIVRSPSYGRLVPAHQLHTGISILSGLQADGKCSFYGGARSQ